MIQVRRHIRVLLAVSLALSAALSCSRETLTPEGEKKAVDIAFSIGPFSSATKADVSVFTEMNPDAPVFRGLTGVTLVPFESAGVIQSTDVARAGAMSIGDISSLHPGTGAHFYSSGIDAWIPTGTASMLLYAHAPLAGNDIASKQRFGSLLEVGFDSADSRPAASSLGFAPDVMFHGDGNTPAEAAAITRALNNVLLGPSSQTLVKYNGDHYFTVDINWNETTGDVNLRQAYHQIINDGDLVPGSGPMVESLLTSLYQVLLNYESHNSNPYEVEQDGIYYDAYFSDGVTPVLYKDLYNRLRDVLLARIRSNTYIIVHNETNTITLADETLRNYPETVGLPSGCAVMRWTPTGFVVPQLEGVEGLAPMNRYCFPPSLYYYSNTTIVTSQEEDLGEVYDSPINTQWSQVLAHYTLGTEVTGNTTSIALVTPAHYAMGMMKATVKAERSRLPDNDGLVETSVDATGQNLPVTGVVLGGQYAQRFDFTPNVTEGGEYFLFDNQIPGVYLTVAESNPIYTLSLPTPENKDIYFCLEFRNDTGATFYGADGRILPGRKFYMIGKLTMPPAPRAFNSVFVQDHVTTVDCTIHSLDGAYNSIPDLGLPQLVLGVQTQVNWTLSTPTTLMLE